MTSEIGRTSKPPEYELLFEKAGKNLAEISVSLETLTTSIAAILSAEEPESERSDKKILYEGQCKLVQVFYALCEGLEDKKLQLLALQKRIRI